LLGEFKKHEWAQAQQMMKDPNKFKERLEKYEKEKITPKMLEMIEPIKKQDFFNYTSMKGKSSAAANLCKWVLAVLKYFSIYTRVKPLQDAAAEASA
jgi:dynein heavy chain